MGLKKRVLAVLAGLAFAVPLSGCTIRTIHVLIPDFVSDQVQGVNLFRLDDATAAPVLMSRIDFVSSTTQPDGSELVQYQIVSTDGTTSQTFSVLVVKDPTNSDSAEMELLAGTAGAPGWFKVSTFNPYGSSSLSTAQTYLD